jgi:peptidyl-prolyl cis-trans isomerase B (cyclophilin B)
MYRSALPMHRRALLGLLACGAAVGWAAARAQTAPTPSGAKSPNPTGARSMNPQVELHIAGHGVITLELDAAKAPKTVENFLQYVRDGHYDGTIFHRVIDGFMIQGGGFEPGMKQKPTRAPIENEATNGLKNDRYTIAMARTQAPHSATAQFFINVADNGFLNHTAPTLQGWGYAVFGKVKSGTEVVDAIRKVATGRRGFHDDVPLQDVVITKAVVVHP